MITQLEESKTRLSVALRNLLDAIEWRYEIEDWEPHGLDETERKAFEEATALMAIIGLRNQKR